jgi:hypothetical protein
VYANTIWKITEVSQQADYATSFQGKQKKQTDDNVLLPAFACLSLFVILFSLILIKPR